MGRRQLGAFGVRLLVLGATGIIGQHLRADMPGWVDAVYTSRTADALHVGMDVTDASRTTAALDTIKPDVIINLTGESRPDVVEREPSRFQCVNLYAPFRLALWCESNGAQLIHVSTQAVFSGLDAPYSVTESREPCNEYGKQKKRAENLVGYMPDCVTIARPTFVLGVRPMPQYGRENPVEQMLAGIQPKQVADRWFSPSFAPDVAGALMRIVARLDDRPRIAVYHLGVPVRTSRYEIARALGVDAVAASFADFAGIAPRPLDTTYADGALFGMNFEQGIRDCIQRWNKQKSQAA